MRPTGSKKALEKRRRRAVALLNEGISASKVAKMVRSSESSVYRWKDAYKLQGDKGLDSKPSQSVKPRLSEKQSDELAGIIANGAVESGYQNDLWTLRRVTEVIEKRFGVSYNVTHVWRVLQRMGLSCQKPCRRALQRDEAAIEQWKRQEWPRIKKGPKNRVEA